MSVPGAEAPPAALEDAWRRSDRIFDLVEERALVARPIPLRQPLLFYLGHLPAFAWNHAWRGALGRASATDGFDALFERGIDPPDDARAAIADAPDAWPTAREVRSYRDGVRQALRAVLEDERVRDVVPMLLEHELMHHETLLYMLQELPADAKRAPDSTADAVEPTVAPARARLPIPAGRARLGARRDGCFRWDNEYDEHEVDVPAFGIDAMPVTNAEYRAFVEAGGYAERGLWSDDGWRWLAQSRRAVPHSWRTEGDAWRVRTAFDETSFEQASAWPVCVTHCEARAFARWSGARLPSEAEYQRAAFATPEGAWRAHPWGDAAPGPQHGNLGLTRLRPTAVGAYPAGVSAFGVHELVGNGWEWTETLFRPFPGFKPLRRYPGYSADFFDDRHFVLLGGSWATDLRLVRRSFRNWFQPHYPYVFAKFRCVRPA